MRILLIVTLILASSNLAISQNYCTQIEDNKERLTCYDKLYGKIPSTKSKEFSSKWRSRSNSSDLTDKTNVFLTLDSNEVIDCGWNGGAKISLILRCSENTTAVLLSTGCHMTSSNYNDYGKVTYRLDKNPASAVNMQESTNNRTLGLWSGGKSIPFIKRMFGKQKMLVRATPFNENPFTATFDISGVEKEIKPLRQSCGW